MSDWSIDNGIIFLRLHDGTSYRPTVSELFQQRGANDFSHNGTSYDSPSSVLGIRFSSISVNVEISADFNGNSVQISLLAIKNDNRYSVSIDRGVFADYIIINNTWHYLGGNYAKINQIFEKGEYSFPNLNYTAYMQFKRDLVSCGINLIDNIDEKVQELKVSSSEFYTVGLKAKLFPYQDSGCHWLNFMVNHNCGCLLGDEMGLGKTLQIIALFGSQKSKKNDSHFLVVCPVSLLENWKREIQKFFPSLKVFIHHGSQRTGDYTNLTNYDVVVVSYSNVQADLGMINMIPWDIVAIDEAQNIKNPSAQRTRALKAIKSTTRIAITGTPFENHMTDIWSIIDFIVPGYLGSQSQFESHFTDQISSALELETLITPLIIRRKVADVADDLPPRIDIPTPVIMTEEEAQLYEAHRTGIGQADLQSMRLEDIQKLRMFCTHPMVYDDTISNIDPRTISHKYARLCEILEEIFENGEKALIFTSFNKMVDIIINDVIDRYHVYARYINGSIPADSRQKIVDEFSEYKGPGILVLNPKAAGTGLNITAANHVIHYNLEWNPAIEDQASARAYRRGQKKTVFVHRLFYSGTIEEVINDKIQDKRQLAGTAIIGNLGENYSREDIVRALSISPYSH